MPTYEYLCSACKHKFELFQSITAKPTKKCPKCGKNKVDRLLGTGSGMIFKGSGFYITDYRSEGYKQSAKADSSSASPAPAAPAAASGGDSKPAAAPAAPAPAPAPAKSESKPKGSAKKG